MKLSLAILLVCASVPFALLFVRAARDCPKRVDAGGVLLRVQSRGKGSPTVILETALSEKLQAELAKYARVFTYDHAGRGCSEPTPKPRDAAQLALELRTVLSNAKIEPPFILVARGRDTLYARVFASKYAPETCGLVLIEPEFEEEAPGKTREWLREHYPDGLEEMDAVIRNCLTRPELKSWVFFEWESFLWHQQQALAQASPEFLEAWRTNAAIELHDEMNSDTVYEIIMDVGRSRFDEVVAIDTTLKQLRSATVPPDVPVVLISATGTAPQEAAALMAWEKAKVNAKLARHRQWLAGVPGSQHLLAPDCTAFPGSVVSSAIEPAGPLSQAVRELSLRARSMGGNRSGRPLQP